VYQLLHEETAYGYFSAVDETGVPELAAAAAGWVDVAVAVATEETVAAVVVAVVVAVEAGAEEALEDGAEDEVVDGFSWKMPPADVVGWVAEVVELEAVDEAAGDDAAE